MEGVARVLKLGIVMIASWVRRIVGVKSEMVLRSSVGYYCTSVRRLRRPRLTKGPLTMNNSPRTERKVILATSCATGGCNIGAKVTL